MYNGFISINGNDYTLCELSLLELLHVLEFCRNHNLDDTRHEVIAEFIRRDKAIDK